MEPGYFRTEQFTDEDRAYTGSRFSECTRPLNGDFVIHFNHPTWRDVGTTRRPPPA